MDKRIEVKEVDEGLEEELEERIVAFNVGVTGIDDGRLLRVALRDDDGELVAGLAGWTWGGCGYVDMLWIREQERGRGLGTRLLDAVESEAVGRGCTRMVVSSHSFQAPEFYRRRATWSTGEWRGIRAATPTCIW